MRVGEGLDGVRVLKEMREMWKRRMKE